MEQPIVFPRSSADLISPRMVTNYSLTSTGITYYRAKNTYQRVNNPKYSAPRNPRDHSHSSVPSHANANANPVGGRGGGSKCQTSSHTVNSCLIPLYHITWSQCNFIHGYASEVSGNSVVIVQTF